jgi:hypothetical protein
LRGGLGRRDHATRSWELAPVRGVEAVRAGRPLPPLGIETPDSLTLVLRLARRDPALLDRLARPGVAEAWKDRAANEWKDAVGLGPMRVAATGPGLRLTLAAVRPRSEVPDTIAVRFATGEGRTRAALRAGHVDLVWPLPPFLLDEPLPPGYRMARRTSQRQLLLVMRADRPPANRLATRRALAHGINRPEVLRSLGSAGSAPGVLIPGAGSFSAPGYDLDAMREWMSQGRLGRSFHVTLAWDADGPAARVARGVQEGWARNDVYVEPRPRRGDAWLTEAMEGTSHLLFVEYAPLAPGLAGSLAPIVMPSRGPAVGGFRTGWRTAEFDAALGTGSGRSAPSPVDIGVRVEQELVVLPLAALATEWVEREVAAGFAFGAWPGPRFVRSAR